MQNTVMKGVTVCIGQCFLPYEPDLLTSVRLTSVCWSRHLPAGLHTPLDTLGRALGSQLQKADSGKVGQCLSIKNAHSYFP